MRGRCAALVKTVFYRIARDELARLGADPDIPVVRLNCNGCDPVRLLDDITLLASEADSDPEASKAFSGASVQERADIAAQALKEIDAAQQPWRWS